MKPSLHSSLLVWLTPFTSRCSSMDTDFSHEQPTRDVVFSIATTRHACQRITPPPSSEGPMISEVAVPFRVVCFVRTAPLPSVLQTENRKRKDDTNTPHTNKRRLISPKRRSDRKQPAQHTPAQEAAFAPFWNTSCKASSEKLWWPSGTNCEAPNLTPSTILAASWKAVHLSHQHKGMIQTSRTSSAAAERKASETGQTKKPRKANKRQEMRANQQNKATTSGQAVGEKKEKQLRVHKIRLIPTTEQRALLLTRFTMKRKLYNLVLTIMYRRVNQLINSCLEDNASTKDLLHQFLAHSSRKYQRDKNKHKTRIGTKKRKALENKVEIIQQLIIDHTESLTRGEEGCRKEIVERFLASLMNSIKLKDEFVTGPNLAMRKSNTKDQHYNCITAELHNLAAIAPRDIRLFVVDSLVQAFESNIAKKRINPRHRFTMKLKKLNEDDSITMEFKSVKLSDQQQVTLFQSSKWQIGPMAMEEQFCASKICNNVSISRCQERFYLLLSFDLNKQHLLSPARQAKYAQRLTIVAPEKVVAIDPGVRKMLTYYSPEGSCGYMGVNVNESKKIRRLRSRLRSLKETMDKSCFRGPLNELHTKKKTKRSQCRKRKATRRCHGKITSFVEDQQWKMAHWLLARYETILLPKLGVSRMVKKVQADGSIVVSKRRRKLSSRTCQDMLTLAHGKFMARLIQKCAEYAGRRVIQVSEAWTSKTCGECGTINESLGTSEVFCCPSATCQRTSDRDLHAARNIYLRWLTAAAA